MSLSRAPRRTLFAVGVLTAALALSVCGGDGGGTSGGAAPTSSPPRAASPPPPGASARLRASSSARPSTASGSTSPTSRARSSSSTPGAPGAPLPCRGPHFAKVAGDLKGKDVAFVGLNTRDANKQQALAFEEDYEVPYPSLYDPAGKLILFGFPKGTLSLQGIPSTVVLDKEGKIAARALMALDDTKLRSMIDPLLKEK